MSVQVERNGNEYDAVQYNRGSNWVGQLSKLDVVFEYSHNCDGSVEIESWYIAEGDYIIVRDGVIEDVRSEAAFSKMYDVIDEVEVDTITFKIEDLKNYILSLSIEKDEYWCSEQYLVADTISEFVSYLNVPGRKQLEKFVETIGE